MHQSEPDGLGLFGRIEGELLVSRFRVQFEFQGLAIDAYIDTDRPLFGLIRTTHPESSESKSLGELHLEVLLSFLGLTLPHMASLVLHGMFISQPGLAVEVVQVGRRRTLGYLQFGRGRYYHPSCLTQLFVLLLLLFLLFLFL